MVEGYSEPLHQMKRALHSAMMKKPPERWTILHLVEGETLTAHVRFNFLRKPSSNPQE
jgi:hypothetical protein